MKLNLKQFNEWQHKAVTLLGMSGVGKTRLSCLLRDADWFHYSGDYRIGTHYLDEAILDNLKLEAMQVPFLRDLLRKDSIHISNNMSIDNLQPVSSFLGKLGNPEQGGLGLAEFKRRQGLHHEAEVSAMLDVPAFIEKANNIYGYKHFINDAGGSLCELDSPEVIDALVENTLIIYIQASKDDEEQLIARAKSSPKPMFYRDEFLNEQLEVYLKEQQIEYAALIEPDAFVRWVFPRLFHSRIPRYEAIAKEHGYTITTAQLAKVQNETDFLNLIESIL